jgi:cytochrome c oxidase assembly protein subunit 15
MNTVLRKQLATWLLLVAACVFSMVVVGGLTRLTESGLSIVQWKPFTGTFPPMSAKAWQAEFADYQTSPQYEQINKGMSLEEFKGIFWLEYWHRVGGRLIGFIFLLPMLYFFIRHHLPTWVKWRVVGLFALGGLQGFIGWYMVKSGLVDVPQVSQYRLALHLGVAFAIMGCCIWVAREVMEEGQGIGYRVQGSGNTSLKDNCPLPVVGREAARHLSAIKNIAAIICILTFVQVLLGALVAGMDAGLTFNTFPLMDGRFVPKDLYMLEPAWRNHFENITMVQFQHRIGAYALTAAIITFVAFAWRSAINSGMRWQLMLVLGVLLLQVGLGIATLVMVVPIMLASKHQAVAAILFALTVWVWYDFRRLAKNEPAKAEEPAGAGMKANLQAAPEH